MKMLVEKRMPQSRELSRQVGCQKYGFCFSKTRLQIVASKNPYFQKVPLIEKWTQSSFPLIPFFPVNPETCKVRRRQRLDEVNKGIRVDEKEAALLLRGLLQNKGSMQKKNEYIFAPIAHFVQPSAGGIHENNSITKEELANLNEKFITCNGI